MIRLRTLSVLQFTGVDSRQFLHNQLSADILAIPDGGAGFACCCNPSGRVLGLLLVVPGDDCVFAACAASLAEPLMDWLRRFVLRDDVRISHRDDLAVAGVEPGDGSPASDPGIGLSYAIVPAETAASDDSAECDWRARELRAGVAWLDASTSGRFLPQMLGAERIGALSFKKGCYPGQEVIARTRYLGKLKRHPLVVRLAGAESPAIGDRPEVVSGDEVHSSEVVDVVPTKDSGTVLLLVVRAAEPPVPSSLELAGREWPVTATDA